MHSDETIVPGGEGNAAGRPAAGGGSPFEAPSAEIGPYKLLKPLGEGGFGTVWLAERRHPFVQQVALKIVKAGMDSKAVVARFDQERQALAVMNHPHVAKVLDGGITPQGRPYFAMEYVKGEPITEFCDRHKLTVKERLSLFLQVCEAVQHAHTKGIIHRDLKPSNVLVSMAEDDQPSAKVIDFGIAKAVTGRMTEQTVFTETGQMIGTPEYMSPEQADPGETDIDTRTDVYSLGVILYEILSGALPFEPTELRSRAYREIQRVIREDDPPTPSARLSTIATKDTALASKIGQSRREPVSTLASLLKSELEWIPLKAMRKDRRERYDSAGDLARDVENYLQGKPLVAAPESTAYRVRKYVRRNRGFVVAAFTVLAALVVGLGLATWQWRAADHARRQAEASAAIGASYRAVDVAAHGQFDALTKELRALERVGWDQRFTYRWLHALMPQKLRLGEPDRTDSLGGLSRLAMAPDGSVVFGIASDNGRLVRIDPATLEATDVSGLPGGKCTCLAAAPDVPILAVGREDGSVTVWNFADAQVIGNVPATGKAVRSIAVTNDGGTVFATDAGSAVARAIDVASGSSRSIPGSDALEPVDLRLASSGQLLTIRGELGVQVHDAGSLASIASFTFGGERPKGSWSMTPASRPPGLAVDRMGTSIAFAAPQPEHRFDAEALFVLPVPVMGEPRSRLGGEGLSGIGRMQFIDGDRTLMSVTKTGTVESWTVASGAVNRTPTSLGDHTVQDLAALPDGSMLLVTGSDAIERLRMPQVLRPSFPRRPNSFWDWLRVSYERTSVACINCQFSPDGQFLLAALAPQGVQVWDTATGRPVTILPTKGLASEDGMDPCGACFTADGKSLASGDGTDVVIWRAPCWLESARLKGHEETVTCVAAAVDGNLLASGSEDRTVRLWSTSGGAIAVLKGHEDQVTHLAWSPAGDRIASIDSSGHVLVHRVPDGTLVGQWRMGEHSPDETIIAFDHDGGRLLVGDSSGTLQARRPSDGTLLEELAGLEGFITSISTAPDGTIAVCATGNGNDHGLTGGDAMISTVTFLDGQTLARMGTLRSEGEAACHAVFDRSGQALALASWSGRVELRSAEPFAQALQRRAERDRAITQSRPTILGWCGGKPDRKFIEGLPRRIADLAAVSDRERGILMLAGAAIAAEGHDLDLAIRDRIRSFERTQDVEGILMLCDRPAFDALPADTLNDAAFACLRSKRLGDAAPRLAKVLRLAERAAQLTDRQDPLVLDTLALAKWKRGERNEAIAMQRDAVALAQKRLASARNPRDSREGSARSRAAEAEVRELQETLRRYEAEAATPEGEPRRRD